MALSAATAPLYACGIGESDRAVRSVEMSSDYRGSLRSIVSVGSASVVNVLAGLVKMKVAAVVLGPAGVGIINLFQQVVGTASTIAALGLSNSGTREVAAARSGQDVSELAAVRHALLWGTVALASIAATAVFLMREPLAALVLADPLRASEVGWLAIGVFLTVMAGSRRAVVNGYRRITELALINLLTGVVSAVIAISALLLWRDGAVVVFVLSSPLVSFMLASWFSSRLPRPPDHVVHWKHVGQAWRRMAMLGASFMLAATVVSAGHLVVKTLLQQQLGAEALGLFSAVWLISQYSIGFLYTAITADFYPRLAAVAPHDASFSRIINEQAELGLLIAAPILLAMLTFAPYVLQLLYSEEFVGASGLLQWFVLGDVLKTVAHPLGFALLAMSAGRTYLIVRLLATLSYVAAVWLLLTPVGLLGVGVAYVVMYVIYLPTLLLITARRSEFRLTQRVVAPMTALLVLCTAVVLVSHVSEYGALIVGGCAASAWLVAAVGLLVRRGALPNPKMLVRLASRRRREDT